MPKLARGTKKFYNQLITQPLSRFICGRKNRPQIPICSSFCSPIFSLLCSFSA